MYGAVDRSVDPRLFQRKEKGKDLVLALPEGWTEMKADALFQSYWRASDQAKFEVKLDTDPSETSSRG